jgi:PIN domain nuclease of toxin-antitoxin system
MLADRGRIRIPMPFRAWATEALTRFPLNEASLNREVALTSLEVALPHRDPADRFISATTLVYDLVLLTVDERLTKAGGIPTRRR